MSEDINKIIKEIGRNNFVEEDWLNNDWIIAKRGNEEFEYFADWKLIKDYNFKHILLYILDVETLFFFKMRAIDEKINIAKEEPRQQDIKDILIIMKIFNENDICNIKNYKMSSCIEYFPNAKNYIKNIL